MLREAAKRTDKDFAGFTYTQTNVLDGQTYSVSFSEEEFAKHMAAAGGAAAGDRGRVESDAAMDDRFDDEAAEREAAMQFSTKK